jgi:hypothetical protein
LKIDSAHWRIQEEGRKPGTKTLARVRVIADFVADILQVHYSECRNGNAKWCLGPAYELI